MSRGGIRLALIAVAIMAVFFGVAYLRSRPTAPAAVPGMAFTGTYADDWQGNCGALVGDAQVDCTKRLDAHYGRSAGAPVPVPAPGAGGY